MKYDIYETEPLEAFNKTFYGVSVENDDGLVIYTEYFEDAFHAENHISRITKLLKLLSAKENLLCQICVEKY